MALKPEGRFNPLAIFAARSSALSPFAYVTSSASANACISDFFIASRKVLSFLGFGFGVVGDIGVSVFCFLVGGSSGSGAGSALLDLAPMVSGQWKLDGPDVFYSLRTKIKAAKRLVSSAIFSKPSACAWRVAAAPRPIERAG